MRVLTGERPCKRCDFDDGLGLTCPVCGEEFCSACFVPNYEDPEGRIYCPRCEALIITTPATLFKTVISRIPVL